MDSFQHYDWGLKACLAAYHQERLNNEGVINACLKAFVAFFCGYDVKKCPDVQAYMPDVSSQQQLKRDIAKRPSTVTYPTNDQHGPVTTNSVLNTRHRDSSEGKRAENSNREKAPLAPPIPPVHLSTTLVKERDSIREPRVLDGSPIAKIERLCFFRKFPDKEDEIADRLNDIRKILDENPGVSINDTMKWDWGGVTPMMGVAANGCSEICVALMQELGASPFVQDETGKHLLHLLIAKRHKEDSSRRDRENQMPLFEAALKHPEITENINKPDIFGLTPLHYACARRDPDYIKLLIAAGADPKLKDKNGNDCFDVLALDEQTRVNIVALAVSGSVLGYDRSRLSPDYLIGDDKTIYQIRGMDNGVGDGESRNDEVINLSYICSIENSHNFNRDINPLRKMMEL